MDVDIRNYCLEQMTDNERVYFLQNEQEILPGVILVGKEFLALEKLHNQLDNARNVLEYSIAAKELFEYFSEPRVCLHSNERYRNMILSLGFKMKNIIHSGFSLEDIPINANIFEHFAKMASFDWDGLDKTIDNVISIIEKIMPKAELDPSVTVLVKGINASTFDNLD